jgi:hypothetical protein
MPICVLVGNGGKLEASAESYPACSQYAMATPAEFNSLQTQIDSLTAQVATLSGTGYLEVRLPPVQASDAGEAFEVGFAVTFIFWLIAFGFSRIYAFIRQLD